MELLQDGFFKFCWSPLPPVSVLSNTKHVLDLSLYWTQMLTMIVISRCSLLSFRGTLDVQTYYSLFMNNYGVTDEYLLVIVVFLHYW